MKGMGVGAKESKNEGKGGKGLKIDGNGCKDVGERGKQEWKEEMHKRRGGGSGE